MRWWSVVGSSWRFALLGAFTKVIPRHIIRIKWVSEFFYTSIPSHQGLMGLYVPNPLGSTVRIC